MSNRFEMKPLVRKQNPAFSTSNLKSTKKKRKRKLKVILLQIAFLIVLFAFIYFLLFTYRYKSISVDGLNSLQKTEIENVIKPYIPDSGFSSILSNPLFVRSATIEKAVTDYSFLIKSVKITHDYFGFKDPILGVHITEREPYATWCNMEITNQLHPETCHVIDSEGFAFKEEATSTIDTNFLMFKNNSSTFANIFSGNTNSFKKIIWVINQINATVLPQKVVSVVELAPNQYSFITDSQISINIDTENFIDVELARLHQVWERPDIKESSYVDFRFGNKVFYKPVIIATSTKSATPINNKSATSSSATGTRI